MKHISKTLYNVRNEFYDANSTLRCTKCGIPALNKFLSAGLGDFKKSSLERWCKITRAGDSLPFF